LRYKMRHSLFSVLIPLFMVIPHSVGLTSSALPSQAPLRVAIAGLVHGHAEGFFQNSGHRQDIQIVGIAEADQELASKYVTRFGLDRKLRFIDLDDMLQKTHPQAVMAYTNT